MSLTTLVCFTVSDNRRYSSPQRSTFRPRKHGYGISLQSCIRAEIYVISYVIPVNGRHLWFSTYPDVGLYTPTSLSVFPDPENMGIAVGISLQSCIRAEIYIISYVVSVNGRHLWFSTYPDVGLYTPTSLSVFPDPENMGIAIGILLLSCIYVCKGLYKLRCTLSHFYCRLMATIFDFRHTQASDSISTSLSLLPDPENMDMEFRCNHVYELRYTLFPM